MGKGKLILIGLAVLLNIPVILSICNGTFLYGYTPYIAVMLALDCAAIGTAILFPLMKYIIDHWDEPFGKNN